jgi:BASS family bile acid:Na+ symporter
MSSIYPLIEYPLAAGGLILAMLGMGATLTLRDFQAILLRPQPVALVLVLQYTLLPMLAALVARLLDWPPGLAVGFVLMNAVPSGSLTNVYTYLGRGNISLSVIITCASTLACFVATPLMIKWLAPADLPSEFRIPFDETVFHVFFFLLLPLAAGMLLARRWPEHKDPFARWMIRFSLVLLAALVIGALGSGTIKIAEYGWQLPVVLCVFAYCSLLFTRRLAMLIGYNWADGFTMGIETAVRNGKLGIALAASLFPVRSNDPIGGEVLFVALFYAGATMVVGLMAVIWRRVMLAREERAVLNAGPNQPRSKGPVSETSEPIKP